MAGSPQYKVYTEDKEYIASCKYLEDCAALVSQHGDGATIRWGHKIILYTQGKDGDAGESFDTAATLCHIRLSDHLQVLRR